VRALLGLVALVLVPDTARAEEIPRLFVVWEAPAGCPDRDGFVRLLAGHLAGEAPATPMHVEVEVVPAGRELALTLRTRSGEDGGERVLHGRNCGVLADTAALTLALAIAPEAVKLAAGGATGPERADDDERPPKGARGPGPAPVAGVDAPAAGGREWGIPLAVRLGIDGGVGGVPGMGVGVAGALAVRMRRWLRVELSGRYWFEKSAQAESDPSIGLMMSAAATGLRMCAQVVGRRRWAIEGCGGVELVRNRAVATGVAQPRPAIDLAWTAGGGVAWSWKFTDLLGIRVDGEVVRQQSVSPFVNDERTVVIYQPDRVAVRTGLAVEAHFP
jgi:hypothetical protein